MLKAAVAEGVPEPHGVAVVEGLRLPLDEAARVALPDSVAAEAETEAEGVRLAELRGEDEAHCEGLCDAVAQGLGEAEAQGEAEGDHETVKMVEAVTESDGVTLVVDDADAEREAEEQGEGVCAAEREALDAEARGDAESVMPAVALACCRENDAAALALAFRVALAQTVSEGERLPVELRVAPGAEAEARRLALALRLSEDVTDGETLPLVLADAVCADDGAARRSRRSSAARRASCGKDTAAVIAGEREARDCGRAAGKGRKKNQRGDGRGIAESFASRAERRQGGRRGAEKVPSMGGGAKLKSKFSGPPPPPPAAPPAGWPPGESALLLQAAASLAPRQINTLHKYFKIRGWGAPQPATAAACQCSASPHCHFFRIG